MSFSPKQSERRIGWQDLPKRTPSECRVLLVEDNPRLREAMTHVLRALGYGVRAAGSAEEGDQWLQSDEFDVVLLDIELPGMSGMEFLRWCLVKKPELPIIMLTSFDDAQLAISAMEQGARSYLVKPAATDFLRLALQDAISLSQVLKERNAAVGAPQAHLRAVHV
jgi:DNA-binding NtrC family response regulator